VRRIRRSAPLARRNRRSALDFIYPICLLLHLEEDGPSEQLPALERAVSLPYCLMKLAAVKGKNEHIGRPEFWFHSFRDADLLESKASVDREEVNRMER
jgi:hypothetical protein